MDSLYLYYGFKQKDYSSKLMLIGSIRIVASGPIRHAAPILGTRAQSS
jgi:hypothetical protein